MKNLFLINEDERSRILNLHETATKNQYLITENISSDVATIKFESDKGDTSANKQEILKVIKKYDTFKKFNDLISTYYTTYRVQLGKSINVIKISDTEYKELSDFLKTIGYEMLVQSGQWVFKSLKPPTNLQYKEFIGKYPCFESVRENAKALFTKTGELVIKLGDNYYYNNGKKMLANGTMAKYTCNDKEFITNSSSTTTTNTNTNKQRIPQPSDSDLDNYLNQQ